MIIEGRSGWRLEVDAGGGLLEVRGWLGCVDAPGGGVIPEVGKWVPGWGVGDVF